MTIDLPSLHTFAQQNDRRLSSGDRIWILTDTESFFSSYLDWSVPQQWYRVGALDLKTEELYYFKFSVDDVRAMLKAGLPPAPWLERLSTGIELTRLCHGSQEKGRFQEEVKLIDLDPAVVMQGHRLRGYFERNLHFCGNSYPDMWNQMHEKAKRERLVETTALSMPGWFSVSDLKGALGLAKEESVTPILARLVKEGRLKPNGKKKRGAAYMVAPPKVIERVDWTG